VIPPSGVGRPGELAGFVAPSCGGTAGALALPSGLKAIGAVGITGGTFGTWRTGAPACAVEATPPGGVIGSGGGASEMGERTCEKSNVGDSIAMVDSPPSSSSSSWSFGTSSSARSPPITFSWP